MKRNQKLFQRPSQFKEVQKLMGHLPSKFVSNKNFGGSQYSQLEIEKG